MKNRTRFLVSFGLIVLATTLFAYPAKWVHVRVEDQGGGERVKVNVPLSLIETVLPLIEDEEFVRGRVKIKHGDLDVAELRAIWASLRSQGDYQLADIQDANTNVQVAMEGDYLIVRSVEGSDTEVQVQVPTQVVDALFSGDEDELNLMAAIQAMAESGVSEVVRVQDGDTNVRVWIDDDSKGLQE